MQTDFPHITEAVSAASPGRAWLVVSQVKSHRVVYFTDDPEYQPPTDGDWYYVSPYVGELPEGMSLRNCWGWRFNGMEFSDARQPPTKNARVALLEHNKAALHKLLREKVDALRKPLAPATAMGGELRAAKLTEAQQILNGSADEAQLQLLPTAAAARGISLAQMAAQVLELHRQNQHALVQSECVREEIAVAIDKARTQEELLSLRSRLMEELVPETTALYAHRPADQTARQFDAAPTAEQLGQEQLRLRVQLRLKINQLRRDYVSDYLLDDVVLRHKGRVAQQVLAAGGAVPPGVDALPIISHAASRGMTLVDAAREVLGEMDETARVLLETEQMKDALLSRIAGVKSFDDIEMTGKAIQALTNSKGMQ